MTGNATAQRCACGSTLILKRGALWCGHCDNPCGRRPCFHCKNLGVKR